MIRAVSAFRDAIGEVLMNIMGEAPALQVAPVISADFDKADFMARMSLERKSDALGRGWLFVSMPTDSASALVETMLAFPDEGIKDADILDGLGELLNVVAGGAKARLSGSPFHFMLSIPRCKKFIDDDERTCPIVGGVQVSVETSMGPMEFFFSLEAGEAAVEDSKKVDKE